MNKILFAIFFFACFANSLQSQTPCLLPIGCEDKFYPYMLCEDGNYKVDCTNQPNDEVNMKPLKNTINCTSYDFGSYTQVAFIKYVTETVTDWSPVVGTVTDKNDPDYGKEYYGIDSGGYIFEKFKTGDHKETNPVNIGNNRLIYAYDDDPNSGIVFDINKVGSLFNEALQEWKNLSCEFNVNCYQSNNVTNCCTNVKWSDEISDFIIDNIDYSDKSSAFSIANVTSDCKRSCTDLTIFINQTIKFTGYGYNGKDIYNDRYFITDDNGVKRPGWVSIKAIFLHELGHILGFADQYNGTGLSCPSNGSIMGAIDHSWLYMDKDINDDDICMYKKLYCWSPLLDVNNQQAVEQGVQIFPNPTNTDILNLQFSNPEFKNMSYQIISQIGDVVLKGDIKAEENLKTIELKTLSNGNYIFIMNSNGTQESKKFVVNK